MLRITLKTLGVITLLLILVTSCKKKNDQKSKTELLTQKEWLYSKSEEKLNAGAWVDDFPSWPACEKDNKIVFRTNNTMEENEGATKCDPSDPQIVFTSAWAFTENDTKITLFGTSATVDQLDENTLIVTSQESVGGTTYYYRTTFRH